MHEVSVCKSLINQILELCVEKNIDTGDQNRKLKVHVQIGPFCGVVSEYLAHAYDVTKQNTSLARSELVIQEVDIRIKCLDCGHESEASITDLRCTECQSSKTQLLSGDELYIEQIEIVD
jgi:hydrogenase nickel incorporation protein HypA/HybF